MNLQLDFIVEAVKGRLLSGNCAVVHEVSTDSRKVGPGSLFVALKGEHFDGHDFVVKAIEKGATAVLVSRRDLALPSGCKAAVILVDDTLAAMQNLAACYRQRFTLPTIAITGSVGKTTTKDILADLLARRYRTLKTQGNYNNEIGLPMTLFHLQPEHQAAVLEMGMRASGEIHHLASILNPRYAIITNVEAVHLETMGTLENIAKAKCEVLEFIKNDGFALLNGDNQLLLDTAGRFSCRKYLFGCKDGNHIQIKSLLHDGEGIQVRLQLFECEEDFTLPVPVSQLAYNLAAAVGMAWLMGVSCEEMRAALKDFQPGGNRMHMTELSGGGVLIDDSYNANPISVMAALEACQKISRGRRKIAILGDMLELGDYAREGHLKAGRHAVQVAMDLLVTIGPLSQYYREGAIAQGMPENRTRHFADRQTALDWLQANVSPADVILVKASRGMHLDELARELFR
ncbi:MAG TPA: UDP-N-acetylmuramoyl-tripeptide--D-alanyl-D-alanine ligase [Syntrophomonas sp.]|nr:UDP-N-acetylmuramoyl-tripeptide--D-alanyl-D-alanine ligase [Syntrophomonas sp.]